MRYSDIKLRPQRAVTEQELSEIRQSPSAYAEFLKSPAAQGMLAGFEAELIFSGLGGTGDDLELEPDFSEDYQPSSIDDVIDFYSDGPYSDLSRNQAHRVASSMEQDYLEWVGEKIDEGWNNEGYEYLSDYIDNNNEFDEDEAREQAEAEVAEREDLDDDQKESLIDDMVNSKREQFVQSVWDESYGNSIFEAAYDEYRDEMYGDYSPADWINDNGWLMSEIGEHYNLSWPYYTEVGSNEDGFSEENAERLADSLSEALGVKTTVASGYHSAKRDTSTWIFEPDGSLSADNNGDMPVEIVSPPMPLEQTLAILPKFFAWAVENGAYANKSTGFHMSVSVPEFNQQRLDYTKLAVLLGDNYVLERFGRAANTYAASALGKIKQRVTDENATEILNKMRGHLDQFASRALALPSGFGKYVSINPKSQYIEFRSAGGRDYFDDMDKVQQTMLRYARAMSSAVDPEADKQEYAKKLYKLLTKVETQQVTDPKTGRKSTEVKPRDGEDPIWIFSRYASGQLPKSALKSFIKQLQYGREVKKNQPTEKIRWRVTHPNGNTSIEVSASSEAEAIQIAKREYNDNMNPDGAYRAVPLQPQGTVDVTPPNADQDSITAGSIPINNPRGVFVMRRREGNDPVGPVLYRFDAPNNAEAIQIARRWAAARGFERHTVWLDHVDSVPPEILNARQTTAQQPAGEFTGQWKIVVSGGQNAGVELTRFGGIGNNQADANRHAARWLADNGYGSGTEVEVLPVMR